MDQERGVDSMETTALYVELVIIGLEVSLWITSFSIYFTDVKYFPQMIETMEKLPVSILLIGVMYILGLIFDRAADTLFAPVEKCCRFKSGLVADSTILIWKKSNQEEYFKFTRSKLRILRASSINVPLFFIALLLNIVRGIGWEAVIFWFALAIGIGLSIFSVWGCWDAMMKFYKKSAILERAL